MKAARIVAMHFAVCKTRDARTESERPAFPITWEYYRGNVLGGKVFKKSVDAYGLTILFDDRLIRKLGL